MIFCLAAPPSDDSTGAVSQPFQRHAALRQFLLQNVAHRFQLEFVDRVQHDRLLALEFDIGLRILQIEAGMDFFQRLLDGIGDFLQIDLAYDVKSIFRHCAAL